jgi:hypothetical protein
VVSDVDRHRNIRFYVRLPGRKKGCLIAALVREINERHQFGTTTVSVLRDG